MQQTSGMGYARFSELDKYCCYFGFFYAFCMRSFGDQYRAYLRGQLTIHKNDYHVNRIWRGCTHLTNYSERLEVREMLCAAHTFGAIGREHSKLFRAKLKSS